MNQAAALALIGGVLVLVTTLARAGSQPMYRTMFGLCGSLLNFGIAYGLYYRRSRVVAVVQLCLALPVLGLLVVGGVIAGANIAVIAVFAFGLLIWIRAAVGAFRYHAILKQETAQHSASLAKSPS